MITVINQEPLVTRDDLKDLFTEGAILTAEHFATLIDNTALTTEAVRPQAVRIFKRLSSSDLTTASYNKDLPEIYYVEFHSPQPILDGILNLYIDSTRATYNEYLTLDLSAILEDETAIDALLAANFPDHTHIIAYTGFDTMQGYTYRIFTDPNATAYGSNGDTYALVTNLQAEQEVLLEIEAIVSPQETTTDSDSPRDSDMDDDNGGNSNDPALELLS